jgi:hypothetical protein
MNLEKEYECMEWIDQKQNMWLALSAQNFLPI